MICKLLLITFLSLSVSLTLAQNPWDLWEAEVVKELNTASQVNYLSEEEKKVILFMNMARHDGPLFARTFLAAYVQEKQVENSSYLRSLRKDLNKVERWVPLQPEQDLTAEAQGHAIKSGKTGLVGHQDFKKRFDSLMGNPYTHVGENCSYGYETAIDIVISLLIDEGVQDQGHRHNILMVDFNSVGVAIRPHKTYRNNCVMDFGHRDRSGLNEVP
ncbi:MAG: CAP domain-containing protein [Bacteroidia bacterium]|nr:MAG: CAP domain-containing protein [Bacteroidia bacterium]